LKNALLSTALFSGFTAIAAAQSSVTLYGVLDGGLRYQDWRVLAGPLAKSDVDTSSIAVVSGSQSTSRFGVKGVEDLGSGNQVVWALEAQVNVQDGSAGSYSTWQRQSTIGLRNEAWGQIDLGRQYNLAYKFAGAPIDGAFGVNVPIINISGVMGITGVRQSNMLQYLSPSLSGLKFGAQYSFNTGLTSNRQLATGGHTSDNATGSSFDTVNNLRNFSAAVSYGSGPFYIAVVYDQFTPPSNTVSGANGDSARSWIAGASYDAKWMKVGVAYNQVRGGLINGASMSSVSSDIINTMANGGVVFGAGAGTNAWNINLTAPVGASGTVMAGYQGMSALGTVADVGGATQSTYGLGYSYKFSARTNVYAFYSYVNNYQLNPGLSGNAVSVGLRHIF
jgi:GBP family porin